MKAMQAMTRNVVYIYEDDTLEVAQDIMKEWDIRHLPVVRDRVLVGILSDRDLLVHAEGSISNSKLSERSVRETMTKKPIVSCAGDSISHIAGLMVENKIDCVPIVEDDSHELIGLVTSTDLLNLLREREMLDVSRSLPWAYAVRAYGREIY